MNRWDAFQFVCATLRASLAGRRLDIPSGVDWPGVVAQAGSHLVTPMMAPALVDHADAPSDARDYFAAVQTLTAQRSDLLHTQIGKVTSVLRGAGVQPVLLKGAADLAQGLYRTRGVRLMVDIDVLVDGAKMEQTRDALSVCGYRQLGQPRERRPFVSDTASERPNGLAPVHEPRHDLPFFHEDTGVQVELHRALSFPAFAALLPANDALRRATPVSANGMQFSVLAPTDRIVHHIVHAQLHHQFAKSAIVDLRRLVDLAILLDAFGREIDWKDVEVRFAVNGHADVLADYLAYLAVLLNCHAPAHISDFEPVMARLRAGIEAPRDFEPVMAHLRSGVQAPFKPGEKIGTIASEYWKRFRQRPVLMINLLDLRFWPGRLRNWRDRMRPRYF